MKLTIAEKTWFNYIDALQKINEKAAWVMFDYLEGHGIPESNREVNKMISFAYSISTKYGEAAAALACEMYDKIATISKAYVKAAEPAATATYQEVATAVVGTSKTQNEKLVSNAVGRLVKMAGVDTTMKNAIRDGAEWAWIPWGDTCAFCIMLASRGWQRATKRAMRKGHAEHIHANCNCTYAVRFSNDGGVDGYDPIYYERAYDEAEGGHYRTKINSLRRQFYEEHRTKIREQQNNAYHERTLFKSDDKKNR